jgi:hypothetical protein
VPGASRSVLEVIVPYNEAALVSYLGRIPDAFCSLSTARAMAARSIERANWLAPGAECIGVGCTASLRSDRPKRGDHRFHIAFQTRRGVVTHSVTLQKDARDRDAEETVVATALLNGLAENMGVAQRIPSHFLPGEEPLRASLTDEPLSRFLLGDLSELCVERDGRMRENAPPPSLLLSGSFNPLHDGHTSLALVASAAAGTAVAFEMTTVNADKPPLDDAEICRRVAQFAWKAPLWLTRAPTFAAKARLFPGTLFVVGSDTAARIVDPRFYGNSVPRRDSELTEFRSQGCRFMVAGRADATGRFVSLADLAIPEALCDLFVTIPEQHFRLDISSTQLRDAARL